jgi:hypothetical protein
VYKLWTINPANLVMEFSTAAKVRNVIEVFVEDNGIDALSDHALFSGVTADHAGEIVARDEGIASMLLGFTRKSESN